MAKAKGKKKVTLEQLQAVAANFNEIMFEEGEGIPFEDMEYDELLEEVTETAGELEPADVVSAVTAETLAALKIDCPAEVAEADSEEDEEQEDEEPEEAEAEAEAEEPVEEEEDDDESEAIEEAIGIVSKCKKIEKCLEVAKEFKVKVPPPFRKDLKKLKTYVKGKLEDMLRVEEEEVEEAPKKEEKAKPKSKAKKEKKTSSAKVNEYGHRLNTMTSLIDELLEKGTTEDAAVKAIVKAFPEKDDRLARNKFRANVKAYVAGDTEGWTVEEDKKGKFQLVEV